MRLSIKNTLKFTILTFVAAFFLLNFAFFVLLQNPLDAFSRPLTYGNIYPHPVDIVYTWVNGSDETLITELNRYKSQLYLDKNMDADVPVKRICPFDVCAYGNHVFVSPLPGAGHRQNAFVKLLSLAVSRKLNHTAFNGTGIFRCLGTYRNSNISRHSGLLLQSQISLTDLFQNTSEFAVHIAKFPPSDYVITQVFISAAGSTVGLPVSDRMFLDGFPEIRDSYTEAKWVNKILNASVQPLNLVKSSAKSFLISFSSETEAHSFIEAFNLTAISEGLRWLPAVIVLDTHLAVILNDLSETRFQDNDELRYSLRSVAQHVDFYRHIYIVTNGQVPSWLDLNNPKISVVPHSTIFRNKSHLPTFNSAAIEANLHNIPGLAPHFIYLNDDVFFGRRIYPEDFYSPTIGYKVYLGWSVPNCVESCPNAWLGDGFCDNDCNVPECQWDGGDCIKTHGRPGSVNAPVFGAGNFSNLNHFGSLWSGLTGGCSHACNSNWLADRYCDQACNVDACGFDLGDCGDVDFNKLPTGVVTQSGQVLVVCNESLPFVIDFSNVIGLHDNVTNATIDDVAEVFSSSYTIKYRRMILLFKHIDLCPSCFNSSDQNVTVTITVSVTNSSDRHVSATIRLKPTSLTIDTTTSHQHMSLTTSSAIFPTSQPSSHRELHLLNLSNSVDIANMSVGSLEWLRPIEMSHYRLLLLDGLISPDGYRRLVQQLWLSNNAKKSKAMRMTAFPTRLGLDLLNWGFLPWEGHDTTPATDNSTMRHVLDIYADSLRHSNLQLSDIYGVSQRRVPAHGPHFINTAIISAAHRRFQAAWQRTSAHRFRSPTDLQFAFAYFHYLMAENDSRTLDSVFRSMDTDHSGSLNENELRTLAVTINTNESLSDEFLHQLLATIKQNCTSSVYRLDVPITSLIGCLNWTRYRSLTDPLSRYHFTTIDDNDLLFVMISSNRNRVLSHLDRLRKQPLKFFCLNDNLANSGDNQTVAAIRADIRAFLDYFYPFPSEFERNGTANQGFMRDSRSLLRKLINLGIVVMLLLAVIRLLPLLLKFFLFIFILRRRNTR